MSLRLRNLLTQVKEKERMEGQTSVWNIEPGPSDWESSAPSTRPLLRTNVCLPILPYVLAAVIDEGAYVLFVQGL